MTPNHSYFLDKIQRAPTKNKRFECMLLYARWLEELGDQRAAGWRWIAANRRIPRRKHFFAWKWSFSHKEWLPHALPQEIFDQSLLKPFSRRIHAEQALVEQIC